MAPSALSLDTSEQDTNPSEARDFSTDRPTSHKTRNKHPDYNKPLPPIPIVNSNEEVAPSKFRQSVNLDTSESRAMKTIPLESSSSLFASRQRHYSFPDYNQPLPAIPMDDLKEQLVC
ncbi:hypothetical protein RF11_05549 [Thelohanellus kitauei]|uniref:Uncharacterized protein n=1 Tax=Thelohanellus kitauei TaxID=669202 RepID=A0A0C2ND51_THEKT|nr:hypothetical protein RF11_05549 [Thelohanellus kitauei]